MGLLTTFTIYNDDCYKITENSKEFAETIYHYCHTNQKAGNEFDNIVINQKSIHSNNNAIYLSFGNTVNNMSSYSDNVQYLMKNNPNYFKQALQILEDNVKQLKQEFKKY